MPHNRPTTKKNATAAVSNVATGITWSAISDLVTGFTYGNGLAFQATYDLDYRIATLKVKNGATDTLSFAYAYGDNLNLTSITDTLTAANNQTLGYSPLNRVQTASGIYGAYTFTVDGVGNRTQEIKTLSGTTTTKVLAYPATSNRLSSETTNGTLSRSFTHDGAGNTLTGLPVGATYAMTYTHRNRPYQLKLNGSTVATYLFNALEQLASRAIASPLTPVGTTHYIHDLNGHLIAEATGTSASTAVIVREYIWLDGMPVMAIDGVNTATPTLLAVHTDHLTRPIRLTNASKTQVWNALWTPFGTAHAITGTATQNLRFPGQYFLVEQGMHYNWHRLYDPTTGRYSQPDPLSVIDGPSLYAYVFSSPLMYTDELGLAGQTPPTTLPDGWPKGYPDLPLSDSRLEGLSDAQLRDMAKRLRRAGKTNEANKVQKWQKEKEYRNKTKPRGGPKMRILPGWDWMPPLPPDWECMGRPGGCTRASLEFPSTNTCYAEAN